jgi:phthalate 4,5-dioxygenase oxygenase subunit
MHAGSQSRRMNRAIVALSVTRHNSTFSERDSIVVSPRRQVSSAASCVFPYMLTLEETELLCKVEGEAPIGRMMRRYWLPILPTADLVAGGAPRRVRLLGENLVAFRDSAGRVGLLDENCPHRGASLVLARNEECGLRCLYHGWKIAADGRVLETPPEPEELDFKDKVRATTYAVHEAGGLVWAYLGEPAPEPPFSDFEFTHAPESRVLTLHAVVDCNWVQNLEGVIDSAHSNYLHSNAIQPKAVGGTSVVRPDAGVDRPSNDGAPRIEAQDTDYGYRYAAIRKPIVDADKNHYVRVTLFIAPCFAMFPAPDGFAYLQAFVPVDDDHCHFFFVQLKRDEPFTAEERTLRASRAGLLAGRDTDAHDRPVRNRTNNWLQDRAAMREGRWSGLAGVNLEDIAMQESMGAIYDRRKEHLGTSDIGVIRMRRLMLDAVRTFAADGRAPLGLAMPVPYARLRAEEATIPLARSWKEIGAFAGEPIA